MCGHVYVLSMTLKGSGASEGRSERASLRAASLLGLWVFGETRPGHDVKRPPVFPSFGFVREDRVGLVWEWIHGCTNRWIAFLKGSFGEDPLEDRLIGGCRGRFPMVLSRNKCAAFDFYGFI